MLGGLGFLIAIIAFFGWRKSTKGWQRVAAWVAFGWLMVSILFYVLIFAFASVN